MFIKDSDLSLLSQTVKLNPNNMVVMIDIGGGVASLLYHSKGVSGSGSGLALQNLTGGVSSFIHIEEDADYPNQILDENDSFRIWNLFNRYWHHAENADQADYAGDNFTFKAANRSTQYYQDELAERFNVRVDALHEYIPFEEF